MKRIKSFFKRLYSGYKIDVKVDNRKIKTMSLSDFIDIVIKGESAVVLSVSGDVKIIVGKK